MAARRTKKTKAADAQMVDFLSEGMSGEEQGRHEQEPVGFDAMPNPAGLGAGDEAAFRPISRDYFLSHVTPVTSDLLEPPAESVGDVSHEGYAHDAASHDRLRRRVFVIAGVFAILVAGTWTAITATVLGREGRARAASNPSVADVERQLGQQFSAISDQFEVLRQGIQESASDAQTPPVNAPPEPQAAVMTTTQLDTLRAALGAAAAATSTSTSPSTP